MHTYIHYHELFTTVYTQKLEVVCVHVQVCAHGVCMSVCADVYMHGRAFT